MVLKNIGDKMSYEDLIIATEWKDNEISYEMKEQIEKDKENIKALVKVKQL